MRLWLECHARNCGLCRDGQCPEYSGEEQAICAVGLARAKPGVFMEAIQRVIVLATPVEVRDFPGFGNLGMKMLYLSK